MDYRPQILLGRITKAVGFSGAVAIKLEHKFTDNIPAMESVFVEVEGRPVPFFISVSEYSGGDTLRLKFEGYDSVEKMEEFTGCNVFLTTAGNPEIPARNNADITGYTVLLKDGTLLGKVRELVNNPGQDLLTVISAVRKEILVPFHEDLILRLDSKKKTIIMDLPEGITDLNR